MIGFKPMRCSSVAQTSTGLSGCWARIAYACPTKRARLGARLAWQPVSSGIQRRRCCGCRGGSAMTIKTAFVVQPFTTEGRRNGRLIPLPKREAQSEEHACHQAEYLAPRRAGAAALALTVDTTSGTMRQMRVLASFGNVPDDFSTLAPHLRSRVISESLAHHDSW